MQEALQVRADVWIVCEAWLQLLRREVCFAIVTEQRMSEKIHLHYLTV